jgi:hypothetical protein
LVGAMSSTTQGHGRGRALIPAFLMTVIFIGGASG